MNSKHKAVLAESDFWLAKPSPLGWRGVSLLVPACASAVGFFAFAVLGFGFTELAVLPEAFRTGLVLTGAFALAFGGEIGTLSNTVEIFRKRGNITAWDWLALVVSVLATLAAFLLAFAALLGVKATWATWAQLYGPVVLGLLAALDSYGGFVEFGLYLNTFDERMREWQAAYRQAVLNTVEAERQATTVKPEPAPASITVATNSEAVPVVSTLETARAVKGEQDAREKAARLDAMLALYRRDPDAGPSEVSKALGVSRTTVYTYLAELETAGRIHRNGQGVQIL